MGARPVPAALMQALKECLNGSSAEGQRLFKDNFNYKKWKKICKKAGLSDL
jgi:hypothetical protein